MLSKELYNRPVLDMRSGKAVAVATGPIINPHSLKIIGWWCDPKDGPSPRVLLASSVRQMSANGLIIDDLSELSGAEELVRDQETLRINYQLPGKTVRTKRRKLGKVEDFSFTEAMLVQKLYVQQSIIRALNTETLIIDRSQIMEVNDQAIIVRDTEQPALEKAEQPGMAPAPAA